MNYLLIIGCSQRKIQSPGEIPAIERYDGPTYRCLRKFRDTFGFPSHLRILILSAKHKFIIPGKHILNYDMTMTVERANAMKKEVQGYLQRYICFHSIFYGSVDEVFINLGKTYRRTLEGFHWGTISTMEASGGIGLKTQQMKAWLARLMEENHE